MFLTHRNAARSIAFPCRPHVLRLLAAVVMTIGCGRNDPFGRQPLEGMITWEGKPITIGTISLEPAGGQPAGAMTSIRDGRFSFSREAGPCPGEYNVWLHAYDHAGEDADGPPPKEILPQKFLAKSPAQVTIQKVDNNNTNTFTFDLK